MKITIKGNGRIIRLGGFDDDEILEYNAILSDIEVFADGEDITKKKGKYIKSYVFRDDLSNIGEDISEKNCIASFKNQIPFETEFELPVSKEEFDPKKLQLIKSDYEFIDIPYCIMTDRIIYDGVKYYTITDLIDFGFMDFDELTPNL